MYVEVSKCEVFCACLRVCEIVSAFLCEFSLGTALL
jgi:hypothetical protein